MGPGLRVRGVESFWESERAAGRHFERVLPTGRAQVVVDLDSGVATLVGPRTVSAMVKPPRHAAGFSLSGCGLAQIVGGDARHLLDSSIDLRDLGSDVQHDVEAGRHHGAAVRKLAHRLLGRFEVAEQFVIAERLLRSGTPARELSGVLGVDRRQFVPAFRGVVGLAPKHYELLGRFQQTNQRLRSADNESLSTIAVDLGFADQAHMTREVRRLAGCTPSQLQTLRSGPANHVPVAAPE